MARLTFYQQARADGGVRTGIDLDDVTLLQDFREGAADFDPVLLWYVDLRCDGENLPGEADAARQWLRDIAPLIRAEMTAAADQLELGFDPELRPYVREIQQSPDGVRMRLVASAARRLDGRAMADRIRGIEKNWDEILDQLRPMAGIS